jgi:hypothetical protein
MKKVLTSAILISCLFWGCKKVKKISYAGVFKLEKQTISGAGTDTAWIKNQMKIYTDQNYIYGGIATDSSVHIGVGTYELDSSNRIDEHNVFNNRALDSTQIFVVSITKTKDGFISTVPEWARTGSAWYKLTEEYTNLPLTGPSVLDGIWELDKLYKVKGKDTIVQHETRFKVFWRGHVMFIHRYPIDILGTKFKDGFGYGDFNLKGNTLTEEENMSTHKELIGQKFDTKIILKGNDKYTQVVSDDKTHQQTTEIYKRIRKYSMF